MMEDWNRIWWTGGGTASDLRAQNIGIFPNLF
jgi:hypothetical protein